MAWLRICLPHPAGHGTNRLTGRALLDFSLLLAVETGRLSFLLEDDMSMSKALLERMEGDDGIPCFLPDVPPLDCSAIVSVALSGYLLPAPAIASGAAQTFSGKLKI